MAKIYIKRNLKVNTSKVSITNNGPHNTIWYAGEDERAMPELQGGCRIRGGGEGGRALSHSQSEKVPNGLQA